MLEWFRRLVAPETVAEPEPEEAPKRSITGGLSTDYRPGLSRVELLARVESDMIQTRVGGAMDSVKDAARLTSIAVTDQQLAFYGSQSFIGYQLMALLAQNWLIAKACGQPGEDAVRKGWQVTVDGTEELSPDVLDAIKRHDKRLQINEQLQEFAYFGRVFGVRHLMADIQSDDPEYYEKPFNPDGITPGSYRGLTQIDPYWISPVLVSSDADRPESRHFYDPTYWTIQGRRIHRSHLIIFKGPQVADLLKPTYRYGGVSVTQQIYERVYSAERTANEAPMLAQTKRMTVLKTDVKKAMADQTAFDAAMTWWRNKMDNYGANVIGMDDEISQMDTSLADLDATIMTQYQLVASVAGVPVTKLIGTVPKGFNATGEYDESSYHESLESLQTNKLTAVLDRHYLCLMRSNIAPKFKVPPPNISVVWNPLDTVTAKEQAEVNLINAQAGAQLVTSGAIDGMDERARITADPKSGYHALPEVEIEPIEDETNTDGNPSAVAN